MSLEIAKCLLGWVAKSALVRKYASRKHCLVVCVLCCWRRKKATLSSVGVTLEVGVKLGISAMRGFL